MYTGFNLKIDKRKQDILNRDEYISIGKDIKTDHERAIYQELEKVLCGSDILDGDFIQNLWFPQEIFGNSNFIFLSHSHNDEALAMKIAGFLQKEFGVKSFIDSCVWLYSEKLNQKLNNCNELEDGYCHNCICRDFIKNISYVHMMLASSLMAMIDKCECVFFLNTPSSMNKNDKTESPWIYYELNIADIVRKESKVKPLTEGVMEFVRKSMEFTPKLDRMTPINEDTLRMWRYNYAKVKGKEDPFETLYKTIKESSN